MRSLTVNLNSLQIESLVFHNYLVHGRRGGRVARAYIIPKNLKFDLPAGGGCHDDRNCSGNQGGDGTRG